MTLSKRSLIKLEQCDQNLQLLMNTAIINSPYEFIITHGHRTTDQQLELYKQGREKQGKIVTYCDGINKKSKHNHLPSKAVDIAVLIASRITWNESYYRAVAKHIIAKAKFLNIKIIWGGDFKLRDYPHFEIP